MEDRNFQTLESAAASFLRNAKIFLLGITVGEPHNKIFLAAKDYFDLGDIQKFDVVGENLSFKIKDDNVVFYIKDEFLYINGKVYYEILKSALGDSKIINSNTLYLLMSVNPIINMFLSAASLDFKELTLLEPKNGAEREIFTTIKKLHDVRICQNKK